MLKKDYVILTARFSGGWVSHIGLRVINPEIKGSSREEKENEISAL